MSENPSSLRRKYSRVVKRMPKAFLGLYQPRVFELKTKNLDFLTGKLYDSARLVNFTSNL